MPRSDGTRPELSSAQRGRAASTLGLPCWLSARILKGACNFPLNLLGSRLRKKIQEILARPLEFVICLSLRVSIMDYWNYPFQILPCSICISRLLFHFLRTIFTCLRSISDIYSLFRNSLFAQKIKDTRHFEYMLKNEEIDRTCKFRREWNRVLRLKAV